MSDGRTNNRIAKIEQALANVQKDIRGLQSLNVSRDQQGASVSPEDAPGREHATAQQQHPFEPKISSAQASRQQTNSPWYKTLNGWKVRLEVIAIPFAIGYAVVTYFQWRDLRHNFQVDERAWIKVRPVKELKDIEGVNDTSKPIGWPITVSNIGKSVAFDIHADAALEVLDKTTPPSFDFSRPHFTMDLAFIFPQEEVKFDVFVGGGPQILSKDDHDGLTSGNRYLAAYSQTVYRDQFGEHWIRSCSWTGAFAEFESVTSMHTFASKPCVDWNAAGEGPPPSGPASC
jgi:hypothetical protein